MALVSHGLQRCCLHAGGVNPMEADADGSQNCAFPHPARQSDPLAVRSVDPVWAATPGAFQARPASAFGAFAVSAQSTATAQLSNRHEASSRHIDEPTFAPAFWERWLSERYEPNGPHSFLLPARVTERSAAEWLDGHDRLIVVSPHPDDEVLMCSGLMLHQLERGGVVQIVALTDGEACFGPNAERAAVGLQRRGEATAGLLALGAAAAEVHHFGLPDGAVADHERGAEQRLRELVQPGDLVVCTWRMDGHPDHEAAGRASALACAARGATLLEAPVWMWHWASPHHPSIDWHRLNRSPLPRAVLERKWQALQCHQSQLEPRGAQQPVIDAALQARSRWHFECFFTA